MVNQISDEEICPEKHRDEGSLFASDKGAHPERGRSVYPELVPRGFDPISRDSTSSTGR
jgi:hypothetical protein